MEEVQKKEFNVHDFYYVVKDFSLENFRGTPKTISVEMSEMQKTLFKYAEVIIFLNNKSQVLNYVGIRQSYER